MSKISLFPYAFELSNLMIIGGPTNPLIKDFLKQVPSNDQIAPNGTGDFSEFSGLDTQLDDGTMIDQIASNLSELKEQKTDDLYAPIGSYPNKRNNIKEQQMRSKFKEERQERIEKENQRIKRIKDRKDQLKKAVKPEDLQQAEQDHYNRIQNMFQSKFSKEMKQKTKQSPKEVAKNNRAALVDYGKETTEMNKKVISQNPRRKSIPEKAEKPPPPFATDLSEWNQRINNEVKEFTSLKDSVFGEEKSEINIESLYTQVTDPALNGTDTKRPDYHMQFAMLFQKLENAEQKIKELENKTDSIVQ